MNERLNQFLRAENITQAKFADTLNVARASISHILSGRNKPGFDFITSLMEHYPDINIEWMLTGRGKMYKSKPAPESASPALDSALAQQTKAYQSQMQDQQSMVYQQQAQEQKKQKAQSQTYGFQNSDKLFPEMAEINPSIDSRELNIAKQQPEHRANSQFSAGVEHSYINVSMSEKERIAEKIVVFFNDGTFKEIKL